MSRHSRIAALIALLAGLGSPTAAEARDREQVFVALQGGILFGGPKVRFIDGIELAYNKAYTIDEPFNYTVGPFGRLLAYKGGAEVALGGRTGFAIAPELWFGYVPRASLELETGFALRTHGGLGLVTGGQLGFPFGALNGGGVIDLGGPEGVIGVDPRLTLGVNFPVLGESQVIAGRPLRGSTGQMRQSPVLTRRLPVPETHTWLKEGQEEHAAVFAFLKLARELAALGAPSSLISRALNAAEEEQVHAALCFTQAETLLEGPVRVRPLTAPARQWGSRAQALTQLAIESLQDGANNEGEAAKRALAESESSLDNTVAEIKALIAEDEARHASLGEEIAHWCIREGGTGVREAVRVAA